jgi:acetyl esterase
MLSTLIMHKEKRMLDPVLEEYLSTTAAAGRTSISEGDVAAARDILELRARTAPPGRVLASVEDKTVRVPHGELRLRVYEGSGDPAGTLVFLHGGGWVIGSIDTYDRLCRELAYQSGARLVSVDYRRAPEHRFPAALDDAVAALRWAVETYPDSPVGVAGDSAGGNLAAVCAIRAKEDGITELALQALIYPVVDSDLSRSSYRQSYPVPPLLSAQDMEWFWNHYVPDVSARMSPAVAPLRHSDHSGLAPAMLVIADNDPLRDEGLKYADALSMAGVPVRLDRYPEMAHGFVGLLGVVDQAQTAVEDLGAWIRNRFSHAYYRSVGEEAVSTRG